MTISAMFSSPEKRDFQLPDLFAQIANNRPVRQLDPRVVVVNIARANRQEIAEGLSILALCGPKTVGVDINFAEPSGDDDLLLEAISNLPNPILPIGVSPTKTDGRFLVEEKPFFYNELPDLKYGVVNLPSQEKGTVREFAINFPTDYGNLPSFVAAIAEDFNPGSIEFLNSKNSETGITSYHSREYKIVDIDNIEEHAEEFTDKIVLVGAMEDAGDMHATPIESHVAGVMIHAAAISTILDGLWTERVPKFFDYILAGLLCLSIMILVYAINPAFKGIVLRFVQALLAFLAVRIGYELFIEHNLIFDLSYTLSIIAFGLFAADIWNSIEAMWKNSLKKLRESASKIVPKEEEREEDLKIRTNIV
ncbi:MAG: CHASE2 domain-containing protein [Muribaculaceae bacterium]|nr:CHASE2 domain-containing protein [Muribaculaceae bacterium]